ncbi:MAG: efflux RND transporter periplasmic adaptor subunit, partial [Steroidobacteraceae bacterium]|nr:efflux RND transporter periplasmic adaptor subunit [Steroidobacteraceae bacterium]MDW8260378.1 efflux RND transporter periplasmic adaptor subunit [Gammaproteobacteria bacterium]
MSAATRPFRFAQAVPALLLSACAQTVPESAPTAQSAPYATLTVAVRQLPIERRVDGRVEAVDQATVVAQTAGEVIEIVRDASDAADADSVVLRLRATQQRAGLEQAEAALREAEARAAEAQTRYQRIADMYAREVVAKAVMDDITAQRDSAMARRAAALAARDAARENYGYTAVRMPFSGVVTDRHVRVGEIVAPGTPLFSAAALGAMRVVADVSQDLATAVRSGVTAVVDAGGRRLDAQRITVYPRAAADSATFRVRMDLPADNGLLPGMFVKVAFMLGNEPRIVVPTSVIVERGEVTGVYVFSGTPN